MLKTFSTKNIINNSSSFLVTKTKTFLSRNSLFPPNRSLLSFQKSRSKFSRMEEEKNKKNSTSFPLKNKVLIISNAFNSLAQQHYVHLKEWGYQVVVELAAGEKEEIRNKQLIQAYKHHQPNITICSFLTSKIPEELYANQTLEAPILILHPGPKGNRSYQSLDICLFNEQKEFGTTMLIADEKMDAGGIMSTVNYMIENTSFERNLTKSSLYRQEGTSSSLKALKETLERYHRGLGPIWTWNKNNLPPLLPILTQEHCKINWKEEDASTIARKIKSRDSLPGVLDKQLIEESFPVFLYGAHVETLYPKELISKHVPGTILAKRDGAILVSAAQNTCLWITHLKRQLNKKQLVCTQNAPSFKLPATMIIPKELLEPIPTWYSTSNTKNNNILDTFEKPFHHKKTIQTWNEIWYECDTDLSSICYVYFEFYNGAMSTDQCKRLTLCLKEIAERKEIKVVLLMGGQDAFSNGIHLNVIEQASNSVQESWENINAMNDIVYQIYNMPSSQITVSLFRGNAGAGGVMLGLASHYVLSYSGLVFNPHYAGMSLFGSEYWTFSLPCRIPNPLLIQELTQSCLPVSSQRALEIGLIDHLIEGETNETKFIEVKMLVLELMKLAVPVRNMEVLNEHLAKARNYELSIMQENFQDPNYMEARRRFVYKEIPMVTPFYLHKSNFKETGKTAIMNGRLIASEIKNQIKERTQKRKEKLGEEEKLLTPTLAILLVGNRPDSELFIREKMKAAKEVGIEVRLTHMVIDETKDDIKRVEGQLIALIETWNDNPDIHGIMVQLPLPYKFLNTQNIISSIALEKDVDGLRWEVPNSLYLPCAVQAILTLLRVYDVKVRGMHVVVVGSSHLLGLPISLELKKQHATVTVCDIHTSSYLLDELLSQADLVISAVGKEKLIRNVKKGACVIDAGIMVVNNNDNNTRKVCGDVDFESVCGKAALLSKVPGGLGPSTVSTLLQHVQQAAFSTCY